MEPDLHPNRFAFSWLSDAVAVRQFSVKDRTTLQAQVWDPFHQAILGSSVERVNREASLFMKASKPKAMSLYQFGVVDHQASRRSRLATDAVRSRTGSELRRGREGGGAPEAVHEVEQQPELILLASSKQ
eukprot:scaffold2626_cov159-Cylindrotheca_fusiformis.AAC.3